MLQEKANWLKQIDKVKKDLIIWFKMRVTYLFNDNCHSIFLTINSYTKIKRWLLLIIKVWILSIKKLLILMMQKDFGYVQDVTADLHTGTITSIIVPGNSNKLFGFFSARKWYNNTMGKYYLYRWWCNFGKILNYKLKIRN